MIPRRDEISEAFGCGKPTATRAVRIIRGLEDPETVPSVRSWISQCYHRPRHEELVMEALDSILGTFGVEWIEELGVEYLNQGDTYAKTLLRTQKGFVLSSIGDYIEAKERMKR